MKLKNCYYEFLLFTKYENVNLIKNDITNYYMNYSGKKKTSILENILHKRP